MDFFNNIEGEVNKISIHFDPGNMDGKIVFIFYEQRKTV